VTLIDGAALTVVMVAVPLTLLPETTPVPVITTGVPIEGGKVNWIEPILPVPFVETCPEAMYTLVALSNPPFVADRAICIWLLGALPIGIRFP